MRFREAVQSCLQLLAVLLFFAGAIFFLLLPEQIDWRFRLIEALEKKPDHFYWGSLLLLGTAVFFLLGFYAVGRGSYLRLQMKPREVIVEAKLLERAFEECITKYFPTQIRGASVTIAAKERLEVAFDLVPMPLEQTEETLERAEEQLSILLRERFGYAKPFTVVLRGK